MGIYERMQLVHGVECVGVSLMVGIVKRVRVNLCNNLLTSGGLAAVAVPNYAVSVAELQLLAHY